MKRSPIFAIYIICLALAGTGQAQERTLNKVPPKKVTMDTNYDGKADRVELYDKDGEISRLESDTNEDGIIDEWIVFDKGDPVKKEKDTNGDGKPDVWVEY